MNKKLKNITSTLVAGKISTSSAALLAAGLGKTPVNNDSTLSLNQIGYPIEILTPPINISNISLTDNGSKYSVQEDTGTIFTAASGKSTSSNKQERIDFIINNIKKQANPVVVFLLYSTTKGDPSQWQDLQLDNVFIDRDSLNIISAYQLEAAVPDIPFKEFSNTPTPLGVVNENETSIIVSLNLSNLNHSDFDGNHIYFQALSIPLVRGGFVFSEAQVSELDHYIISREVPGEANSGSKSASTSSGGKSKEDSTSTPEGNGGKSKNETPPSLPEGNNGGKGK